MKVLAVIPGRGEGISFIFARRQVASLIKIGVPVKVHYLDLQPSPLGLWSAFLKLRRAVESYSPDVVHAYYGTITSLICACSTRRRLAITFQGSDINPDPTLPWLRTRAGYLLSQISVLRASIILCVSGQLRDRLWWKKKQATLLPAGINTSLFQPREIEESRRILGWGRAERIALISVGSAPLLKGLPLAREAVAIAEKRLGPVRLVILDNSVAPEEVPTYLNAADCLLLASESEGSPNIVKEALACNLPVASVNVGDSVQRLNGVWPSQVVPRDAASLGRAVYEILAIPQRSNGRETILSCSEETIAETLRDIYRRHCADPGRGVHDPARAHW